MRTALFVAIGIALLSGVLSMLVPYFNPPPTVVDEPIPMVRAPQFGDFPTTVIPRELRRIVASSAPVSLSNEVESAINDALKADATFAGQYAIAQWSCGAECNLVTIIDNETGMIVEHGIWAPSIDFRKDSSLLVVSDPVAGTEYFVLENAKLRMILKADPAGVLTRMSECPELSITAKNIQTNEEREFMPSCSMPMGWKEL